MDLKERLLKGADWINLTPDRDKWRNLHHVCLPTVQQVTTWKSRKWVFMELDIEDFTEIYRQTHILFKVRKIVS